MDAGKTVVVCAMVACVTSITVRSAAGADAAPGLPARAPSLVRVADPFNARAVRVALEGATRRLQQPLCQELFTDFSDGDGRSLQQNLLALGETGGSYMEKILFYDGHAQGRCRQPQVMAYTQPGSRVVFVCGRAFSAAYRRGEHRMAEAVMIHEALHSLGLGENPPSSAAITARVLQKCGR